MSEETYENLFKNIVINGHYSYEKLNEMKSYIKTLNNKIENLEQQVKKQKEVINKLEFIKNRKSQGASQENINKMAIEFVNSWLKEMGTLRRVTDKMHELEQGSGSDE